MKTGLFAWVCGLPGRTLWSSADTVKSDGRMGEERRQAEQNRRMIISERLTGVFMIASEVSRQVGNERNRHYLIISDLRLFLAWLYNPTPCILHTPWLLSSRSRLCSGVFQPRPLQSMSLLTMNTSLRVNKGWLCVIGLLHILRSPRSSHSLAR